MAVKNWGDIKVEFNANTINSPAVRHFISTVYPAYQARTNPLAGVLVEIPVMGESSHIPRDHGSAAFRPVDRLGDRSPKFASVRQTRVPVKYGAYDLDFRIKEDAQVDAQINQASIIRDKIMSAAARLEFQIVYNVLRQQKLSDTSPEASDGVLGSVPAGYQWNPTTKAVTTDNNKPVGWNIQKMAAITTMRRMGNVEGPVIFVARADTIHGLYEDEQTVNSDYRMLSSAASSTGLTMTLDGRRDPWAIVGQFPPDIDGNPQGVFVEQSGSNYIATEFAFDPRVMVLAVSPETPKFYVRIYRNEEEKDLRFRASLYCGAACINPKGVIIVKNKVSLQDNL